MSLSMKTKARNHPADKDAQLDIKPSFTPCTTLARTWSSRWSHARCSVRSLQLSWSCPVALCQTGPLGRPQRMPDLHSRSAPIALSGLRSDP